MVSEGEGERYVEAVDRYADELDNLLRSLVRLAPSLSFWGDGESSIINTQPESPFLLIALSESLSLLFLESIFLCDSQLVLAVEVFDLTEEDELMGVAVLLLWEGVTCRVMLAIRSRGTRVWIFCSRFLTLALISDTICTPLFLAEAEDDVVAVDVVLTGTTGRGKLRGLGIAEGEERPGSVVERIKLVLVFRGMSGLAFSRCATCDMNEAGTPGLVEAFGVVTVSGIGGTDSLEGETSVRSRFEGGRVLRRFSVDEITGCDVGRDCGGGIARRTESWSLRIEISTLAS